MCRGLTSGVIVVRPSASTTSTGSTVKGRAQYWENIVTTMLSTMRALVRSVAVHSMKTLRVLSEMAECAPLMMGGRERTCGIGGEGGAHEDECRGTGTGSCDSGKGES